MAPGTPFFKSTSKMLSNTGDNKPQAVIVCVPNNHHVQVAREFVAAGIDIVVEKPLTDWIEGKFLFNEVEKNGVKLLVGHHKRFKHSSMATKKVLNSGVLGEITAVSALWTG